VYLDLPLKINFEMILWQLLWTLSALLL